MIPSLIKDRWDEVKDNMTSEQLDLNGTSEMDISNKNLPEIAQNEQSNVSSADPKNIPQNQVLASTTDLKFVSQHPSEMKPASQKVEITPAE